MSTLLRSPRVLVTVAAACFALGLGLALWPQPRPSADDFVPADEDLCIVPVARVGSAIPWDPASGLPMLAARPIPEQARCPVCGMYPARHPRWAAQMIFADGAAHFFDSPVDLFIYLDDASRYDPSRPADSVAALHVSDHLGSGWVEARSAFFVIGSSVRGPMRGADLPAFASAAEADRFAATHGGEVVVFDAIGSERIASLRAINHPH